MSAIVNALENALAADPSNWETRLALTEAWVQGGREDRAIAVLEEGPPPRSEDTGALIAAARAYALVGSSGARGILDPIFATDPGNAEAHLALASIAHREGDATTAARHFITATSLDPALHHSEPGLAEAYGSIVPASPVAEEPEPEGEPAEAPAEEGALVVTEADAFAEDEVVFVGEELIEDEEPEPEPEPEPAEVETVEPFFPEAGHVPVQTLKDAVAASHLKPLIDPASIPTPPVLSLYGERASAAEEHRARLLEWGLKKPILEPHANEHVVYEYENPDDSIFEPAYGPENILVPATHTEDGTPVASPEESLRKHQTDSERSYRRALQRDKFSSLLITAAIHAGVLLVLGIIVISVPRQQPPEIVAYAVTAPVEDPVLERKKVVMPTPRTTASPAAFMPDVVSAFSTSDLSVPTIDNRPMEDSAVFGTGFNPTLNFGTRGTEGQSFLFGEPIEGKKLGVILDVSGSMCDYLPRVIREIDRNFEKASIVFINNAILRDGIETTTEVRPILTDEVVPRVGDRITPYWFLWHDLPRKAEQAAVDRLIEIFKTRPNSYLAVGGHNRIAGGMEFLRTLGIDALYVFSDFEDHIDEDAAVENARALSKRNVKVYVQPAQEATEFLDVMSRKVAARTGGKELKPLIAPVIEEVAPPPLLAEVMDPIPIEVEGINFATPRAERYGTEWHDRHSPGKGWEEIAVFEHKNFDLVLYGPMARAEIFLKTPDGYICHPVGFRYHSRKWLVDELTGKPYWRHRKWLRNREPPLLEGNEITWKMVLEDEINFDVWMVFDENSFMATYAAEIAPDERGDDASIGFHIPPLARQRNDIYYSNDFPQGLTIDRLREAVAPNHAIFKLSTKEVDRYEAGWTLYGWQRGFNVRPYNVLCKRLPAGILDVTVKGQAFGPRVLSVASKTNDILLRSSTYRPDIELWEGYAFRLTRPRDRTRHRLTKTKAFELTIE